MRETAPGSTAVASTKIPGTTEGNGGNKDPAEKAFGGAVGDQGPPHVNTQAARPGFVPDSRPENLGTLRGYITLPAAFSSTTLPTTPVSDVTGRCEVKPMPT